MEKKRAALIIKPETRDKLKALAAIEGKTIHDFVRDLTASEFNRRFVSQEMEQ